jgi:hypothetical protein
LCLKKAHQTNALEAKQQKQRAAQEKQCSRRYSCLTGDLVMLGGWAGVGAVHRFDRQTVVLEAILKIRKLTC